MYILDLCAGIGGIRLGFEQAGFKFSGWCEIDPGASKLYESYFNTQDERYFNDITTINTEELPDFQVLTAGFPCQPFSVTGKRQGFNDTRGTIFHDIVRILQDRKPRCFLLENVKGLLSHDSGNTFKTIVQILTDIGYEVEWQLINSRCFMVPQNRERIYIVGHLRGFNGRTTEGIFPIGKDEIILDESKLQHRYKFSINPLLRSSDTAERRAKALGSFRIVRYLTPKECFRAQGLPDGMVDKAFEIGLSRSKLYQCAGNSVSVPVIKAIAEKIYKMYGH